MAKLSQSRDFFFDLVLVSDCSRYQAENQRWFLRLGDRFRSVWKICEKVETGGVVGLGDSSFLVPVIPAPQHFLHSLILKVVFIMCSAIFVCHDVKQFDWCSFARNPNIRKIYGAGENVYLTPLFGFTNFGESAWMFCFLRCEAVLLATMNLLL